MLDEKKEIKVHPLVRKILLWTSGFGSYYALTWIYDYLVVSFFILYFGLWKGALIVMVLSFIVDLLTLKFYDWFKKDWLALETLKGLENMPGIVGKIFNFVRGKGTVITILVLSLTSNAFVVTTYMRKGAFQYDGMTNRDWVIFIASSTIINVYWIFIIGGGIEVIKYLFNFFTL